MTAYQRAVAEAARLGVAVYRSDSAASILRRIKQIEQVQAEIAARKSAKQAALERWTRRRLYLRPAKPRQAWLDMRLPLDLRPASGRFDYHPQKTTR